jgi:hypothetical protein
MLKTPLELHRDLAVASMTARLNDALTKLRNDSALPATQDTLAELAECSRRLFGTPGRRWVAGELKSIKRSRRAAKVDAKSALKPPQKPEPKSAATAAVDLLRRVENLKRTCGELIFERDRLADELAKTKKSLERVASERDREAAAAAQYRQEIQALGVEVPPVVPGVVRDLPPRRPGHPPRVDPTGLK